MGIERYNLSQVRSGSFEGWIRFGGGETPDGLIVDLRWGYYGADFRDSAGIGQRMEAGFNFQSYVANGKQNMGLFYSSALDGGQGNDTLIGLDSDVAALVSAAVADAGLRALLGSYPIFATGADLLVGGDGDDSAEGRGGDDVLDGGTGVDALSGGDGADTLRGGVGNDSLDGGAGIDLAVFSAQAWRVVDLGGSLLRVETTLPGGATEVDLVRNVELLSFGDELGRGTTVVGSEAEPGGALFTAAAETVNFNALTPEQVRSAVSARGAFHDALGGADTVTLPDAAVIVAATATTPAVIFSHSVPFLGGAGDDLIIGSHGWSDLIDGGPDNDTIKGSAGSDFLFGGSGDDVFDFADGTPAQFGSGDWQRIDGGDGRDTLLLPGRPGDYAVNTRFPAMAPATVEVIGFGQSLGSTFTTKGVEQVHFSLPLNNTVTLLDGNLAVEMALLAKQVYGPHEGYHTTEHLAWSPLANQQQTRGVTDGAVQRGKWRAVEAIELGLAARSDPALAGGDGLRWSMVKGHYQAISGDWWDVKAQGNAMILAGLVPDAQGDLKRTLALVFRGTDQYVDILEWPWFASHYARFQPLINAVRDIIATADSTTAYEQILVAGHSLGAGMVEHALADLDATAREKNVELRAWTFAPPGSEAVAPAGSIAFNLLHTEDPIRATPIYYAAEGTTLRVNTGITNWTVTFQEHGQTGYFANLRTLAQWAADRDSTFGQTALAEAIRSGGTFTESGVQVALPTPINHKEVANDPTLALRYERDIVLSPDDDFALGSAGADRFILTLSGGLVAPGRIIDGGAHPEGKRDILFVPLPGAYFNLDPDGVLMLLRDPFTGSPLVAPQEVGRLERIEGIQFGDQLITLDGRAATVQRPAAGSREFQLAAGFDYADAGDGQRTVYGSLAGDGADVILLGSGSKFVYAEGGADLIAVRGAPLPGQTIFMDGGPGADVMIGSAGREEYRVDNIHDRVIDDAGGADTIVASVDFALPAGVETLVLLWPARAGFGSTLAERLVGHYGDNLLSGGAGDDTLVGNGGADTLMADPGSDSLDGGDGDDVVVFSGNQADYAFLRFGPALRVSDQRTDAPDGADTLLGVETVVFADTILSANALNGATTMSGSPDGDTLPGTAADEVVDALGGADSVLGLGGADTLFGGDGADTLDGGSGADLLVGGADSDTYVIDDPGDIIQEAAGGGTADMVRSFVTHELAAEVERLQLLGSAGISGVGNALANLITGNAGGNSLAGGEGADTLRGLAGADTLFGGRGNDRLEGGTDTDTDLAIYSGARSEYQVTTIPGGYLVTGLGEQSIWGADSVLGVEEFYFGGTILTAAQLFDVIQQGTDGADTLPGTPGPDTLDGLGGNDSLAGLAGADWLIGGAGADTLDGGAGADTMEGGADSDLYFVDNPGDRVTELPGGGNADQVRSVISYELPAEVERLVLLNQAGDADGTGNPLNNLITGNGGANRLTGGEGADTLRGFAGADTLDGGPGGDSLEGGDGTDVAVFGGNRMDYEVATIAGGYRITGINARAADGADTMTGVELFRFADVQQDEAQLIGPPPPPPRLISIAVPVGADNQQGRLRDAVPPAWSMAEPFDLTKGVGWLINLGDDFADFTRHDHGMIAPFLPDPARAKVTFTYNAPVTLDRVALIEHAAGISRIEARIGNTPGSLVSLGDIAGDLGPRSQNDLFLENSLNTFDFDSTLTGTIIEITLTLAVGEGGWALYRLLPIVVGADPALIAGGAAAESLAGSWLHDTITGSDGADTLRGARGDDSLDGGAGSDLAIFAGNRADYAIAALADGGLIVEDLRRPSARYTAQVLATPVDGADTLRGIETYQFADVALDQAGLGLLPVRGGPGAGSLAGTPGADTLEGGAGADSLGGAAGNDVLLGGRAPAILNPGFELYGAHVAQEGGRYLDVTEFTGWGYLPGPSPVQLVAFGGAVAAPAEGARWLDMDTNGDTLLISQELFGLEAGRGYRLIFDLAAYAPGAAANLDILFGGEVIATRHADASGNWHTAQVDLVAGSGDGSNVLQFRDGVNSAIGLDNLRLLDLAAEADTLVGGAGADTLEGGGGADLFLTTVAELNGDALLDFSAGDVLRVQGGSFGAAALSFTVANGRTTVAVDVNGGGAEASFSLNGDVTGLLAVSAAGGNTEIRLATQAFGGKQYLAVAKPGNVTWHQAAAEARALGGHLASIGSAEENAFVFSLVSGEAFRSPNGVHGAWLGGFQQSNGAESAGGWQWLDGTAFGFTAWNNGEPGGGDAEEFLHYHFPNLGQPIWNDVNGIGFPGSDFAIRAFVVEFDAAPGAVSTVPTAGADSLVGTPEANSIDGLGGNDTILGLGAADTLRGGDGDDLIETGGFGGFTPNFHSEYAYGFIGADTIIGGDNSDNIFGEAGDDSLVGGAHHDGLYGGAGNDTIDAGDNLAGFFAMERGQGDDGDDSLRGGEGGQYLLGGDGADTLDGGAGDDSLEGEAGNDSLVGGAGANTLIGGDGADTLRATSGADSVYGGLLDNDLLIWDVSDSPTGVFIRQHGEMEAALILGGSGSDTLYGSAGGDTMSGNAGADSIRGFIGAESLDGGANNDTLQGDEQADTLQGGAGHDSLDGGADDDLAVFAGPRGNYSITANGSDGLFITDSVGGEGADTISAVERFSFDGTILTRAEALAPPVSTVPTPGADSLTGSGIGESINGLGGNDTILGLGGADTLDGGPGADSMLGGADSDTYIVDDAGDVVLETAAGDGAADIVRSFVTYALPDHVERLFLQPSAAINGTGNGLANVVNGNNSANALAGLGGNDTLRGLNGADTLDGGAGNDLLEGGNDVDVAVFTGNYAQYAIAAIGNGFTLIGPDGADTVTDVESFRFADQTRTSLNLLAAAAGPGADTLAGDVGANSLDGLGGNDVIAGGGGHDTLLGNTGDDLLRGEADDDDLRGGPGADTLEGGPGDDTLEGGAGNDLADYAAAPGPVVVDLFIGYAEDGQGGFDALSGIEILRGSAFADLLIGGAGNETVRASAGADTVDGGEGFDLLDFTGRAAPLYAEIESGIASGGIEFSGIEGLLGGAGADVLIGDAGANLLGGGAGNDVLTGGGGSDTLDGGAGEDTMSGGAGGDIYIVDSAGDVVMEGATTGTDWVSTTLAAYTLGARMESLANVGGGGFAGTGNVGRNEIVGGAAADTLSGLGGSDILRGGGGRDLLIGGEGVDRFVFDQASLGAAATHTATVQDLDRALKERLDLVSVDAIMATPEDDAFAFIGTAAFSGVAGQLRWTDLGAQRRIEGDVNGDAVADLTILTNAAGPVTAAWFLL